MHITLDVRCFDRGRKRLYSLTSTGITMSYSAEHIRNFALVGHQGAGKTILSEAMLASAGVINRMGSVESGSTVSDYHPSEIERQMSVHASLLHCT